MRRLEAWEIIVLTIGFIISGCMIAYGVHGLMEHWIAPNPLAVLMFILAIMICRSDNNLKGGTQ